MAVCSGGDDLAVGAVAVLIEHAQVDQIGNGGDTAVLPARYEAAAGDHYADVSAWQ